MALLWVDGFDNYGTTAGSAPSPAGIVSRNYVMSSGSESSTYIRAGRTGLYSLDLGVWNATLRKAVNTTNATLICGVGIKIATSFDASQPFLQFTDEGTLGLGLHLNANGTIYLKAGATTVNTSTFALTAGTWYYVELKITCTSATNYDYELHIGQTLIFNGSDTHKGGSHAYHNGIALVGYSWHYGMTVDDLYICDGSGSYNNDFLGNIVVQLVYPDGDASPNEWTGSNGASHYSLLNEAISDLTTYVEDNVSGHAELFTFQDVTSIGVIKGVVVSVESGETDTTPFNYKIQCVSGATTANGATQLCGSSTYSTRNEIFETNPETGGLWSDTAFNAAKFGFILS
jgi:hypothetical protein